MCIRDSLQVLCSLSATCWSETLGRIDTSSKMWRLIKVKNFKKPARGDWFTVSRLVWGIYNNAKLLTFFFLHKQLQGCQVQNNNDNDNRNSGQKHAGVGSDRGKERAGGLGGWGWGGGRGSWMMVGKIFWSITTSGMILPDGLLNTRYVEPIFP